MSVKYKNLLFDFDGCLVSSIDFWIKIYKEALAEFDSYPSDKELMFHIGDWDMWKHFGVTDEAKFVEIVNAKLGDLHDRQVLSENAQEVLEILSPNHKMAVVSSGVKVNILDALTKNEVDHHFQAIIGVGEVENYKPHPEPVHLAIELLNGSQALEFRRPLQSSAFIESFVKSYREEVSFVSEDRILHYDIEKSITFLNSFQIDLED